MSDLFDKITDLVAQGLGDKFETVRSRVDEEMQFFKDNNLLEDMFMLYRKVVADPAIKGDANSVNSLVAFALGITASPPSLQSPVMLDKRRTYGRSGFPDIDMDFDYVRRHEVFDYIVEKYGRDNVANIGVVQSLKVKAAVRRTIKVLDPTNTVQFDERGKQINTESNFNFALENEILRTLPKPALFKKPDGTFIDRVEDAYQYFDEFRKQMDAYPDIFRVAKKIQGRVAGFGVHAAGVVVSNEPLKSICPLHATTGESNEGKATKVVATQYSMADVESMGLIKFDVLGLSTKTAISKAVQLVKDRHDVDIDLSCLPLKDQITLDFINTGKTDGCFQLEERGMQNTLKMIGIHSFDDLVIAVAMYRPGPKDYIPELSGRKRGDIPVSYPHPLMKEITKVTYGIMVYQEQVMKVFMQLGDLSATEGYKFIKGCAKKKRALIEEPKDRFFRGALSKGVSQEVTQRIWDDMEKFGGYAFNKTLHFSEGVATSKGEYTIEELSQMDRDDLPQVYSPEGKLINIVDVYDHGVVPMYRITLSDGSSHVCTGHHKFASTDGILPLYKIIEIGAQLLINRRVKYANEETMDMPCLWSGDIDKRTMETQEDVLCLEGDEVSELLQSQQKKFPQVLGQHNTRRNANLSKKDVRICFSVDTAKFGRTPATIRNDVSLEQEILQRISKKPNRNSQEDIFTYRHSKQKNKTVENMERGTSRGILREVYQTSNESEGLEVGSRNCPEGDLDPFRISILPDCCQQRFFDEIQSSPGGFLGSPKENSSRVRRAAPFQRRFWKIAKDVCGQGSAVEYGDEKERISDCKNVLRYLDSSSQSIQVHRDGHVDGCNIEQHNSALRDFHWQELQTVDVVNVESVGFCQGYDLEVDSPDHLYCLSSGVVNSNSHACSYAYESFKTAYLKAHFPLEFMAARLSVENERRKFDKVEKYEEDATRNLGIQITEPDLNESKIEYTIVGENTLRRPLLMKGIGIKAAEEIVSHQPYKGSDLLYSFANKVGAAVNSKVMEAMHDLGMWSGIKKAKLLRDFEQIKKDKKRTKGRPVGDMFA